MLSELLEGELSDARGIIQMKEQDIAEQLTIVQEQQGTITAGSFIVLSLLFTRIFIIAP